MSDNDNKQVDNFIASALGVNPIVKEQPQQPQIINVAAPDHANDFEYARRNLYDVIEKGHSALEDMIDIATQSQNPKAYDAVTGILKAMVDANKSLLELSKTRKEIEKDDSKTGPETVNNNLYLTSADLLKMIKDKREDG